MRAHDLATSYPSSSAYDDALDAARLLLREESPALLGRFLPLWSTITSARRPGRR
ncbi:hypothetical protein QQY66_40500 [Streptomyces sp. DG2A-72]|uniref:hypothetical protein n=1 Tax=Streptomyces sp. DG2A-72 TaxID=3051386 RepID=UPI00265BCDBE|nr:hypothetical protein [Streptomyces sp. DG2A-72]MDO0937708.1 hypothetical protein [Streptomyces sp. DG2A-72]